MSSNVVRIELQGLTFARGDRVLAQDLSVTIEAGSLCEVQGPNGSGKTTLLRAIAGFFQCQAGQIRFLSASGEADDPASQLHYLGHRDSLKPPLSVRAHAAFWANLLDGNTDRIDHAFEQVGITQLAQLPARVLSQGQARRLALTRLLIAERPVWLLDEPAAGLDSAGKAILAALVADQLARGGIVFAATHEPLGPASQVLEIGQARSC